MHFKDINFILCGLRRAKHDHRKVWRKLKQVYSYWDDYRKCAANHSEVNEKASIEYRTRVTQVEGETDKVNVITKGEDDEADTSEVIEIGGPTKGNA